MVRILLVDDHQLILDGLSAFIAAEPEWHVIGQAKNGKEALQGVGIHHPHLVLMDVDMPIMNGVATTERLKKQYPEVKVIMLSLHLDKPLIQQCIDVGADGYLYKDASASEVVFAIRTVMTGKPYFSGEAGMVLAGKHLASRQSYVMPSASQKMSQLTKRERGVLTLVAEGLSSTEIGRQLHISPRTVETHRSNIMQKLEVEGLAGIIKFAVQNGLV